MKIYTLLCFGLLAYNAAAQSNPDWWKTSVIYQIYPRSFQDSNGDGIGDLKGITSRLGHIKDIGADALWLSPIYKSPMKDFGYDISDFKDIDPIFGDLDDFKELVKQAKVLKLKVILDFVPNHSSDEHKWFQDSINKTKPYDDYYIWRDGKILPNGTRVPPTNWLSAFGKSAWEWNEDRGQYYYHAFAVGQPDLNYRNQRVREVMDDVLKFWMDLGVEGFRVDAVNHMFECEKLEDEPLSGKPVPPEDYDYLIHTCTRDMHPDNPILAGEWQEVLDNHTKEFNTDEKPMILELYLSSLPTVMEYYDYDAVPFNMMFISDINKVSQPSDFRRVIETWLNAIPEGKVTNWVVGNHDNHRAASRYGDMRADFINMMAAILPGIMVIYNGDEIGMVDRPFTWEETVDPPGIIAGPSRYYLKSRDPERTPYQWDATTSAGFSTNEKTWLPVNKNYKTLNLEAQKNTAVSHYKVFKALTKLKKQSVLKQGSLTMLDKGKVLAVIRKLKQTSDVKKVILLSNFGIDRVVVDARNWLNIEEEMKVYTASVKSGIQVNEIYNTTKITLPPLASVILI